MEAQLIKATSRAEASEQERDEPLNAVRSQADGAEQTEAAAQAQVAAREQKRELAARDTACSLLLVAASRPLDDCACGSLKVH